VNEKTEAIFVVPDDVTEMSMSAIRLCELFVAKVLDATDTVIEVKVDGKLLVVLSDTQSIKELVSMYLKSGRLASFYRQLIALARKDVASGELVLKIVLRNKMYFISLQELNALPNLHLRISKLEVANFKQGLLG
jgi:hypothetical protein